VASAALSWYASSHCTPYARWLTLHRTISHPPQERHRVSRLGRIRQALPLRRRVQLHRLLHASVQSEPQIRLRMRLACILGCGTRCCRPETRWRQDGDCVQ
jgi:hypothetical protein